MFKMCTVVEGVKDPFFFFQNVNDDDLLQKFYYFWNFYKNTLRGGGSPMWEGGRSHVNKLHSPHIILKHGINTLLPHIKFKVSPYPPQITQSRSHNNTVFRKFFFIILKPLFKLSGRNPATITLSQQQKIVKTLKEVKSKTDVLSKFHLTYLLQMSLI